MKNKGFTLLELLIVIAIMGILGLIAAPSFLRLIENQKGREAYQLWQSSYYFAQHESMRLKDKVILCPSNANGTECDLNKKDYEFGWLVINKSKKQIVQDIPINIAKDKTVIAFNGDSIFEFNANGRLNSAPSSIFICIDGRNGYKLGSSGSLNCTKARSYDGKYISISAGGRLQMPKDQKK